MDKAQRKELRPRPFLVGKIAELVGGRERAAEMAGCSRDTMEKCCNLRTGRDLTVADMSKLIQSAGGVVGNRELDRVVDELAGYFVPPGRKIIYDDLIRDQQRLTESLLNGGRSKQWPVVSCRCGNENLVRVDRAGVMTFVCAHCVTGAVPD